MQKIKNSKIYWSVGASVLIIGLAMLGYSVKNKNQDKPIDQENPSLQTPSENQADQSKADAEEVEIEDTEPLEEEKKLDELPDENKRQKVIAYLIKNLDTLIFPPKNDKWDISSAGISFVGNTFVYLEIFPSESEIGGMKALYQVEDFSGDAPKLKELAKYKEGEEDWQLISGEDKFFDYYYEEYGYNETNDKWTKIDYLAEMVDSEEKMTEEELDSLEEEEALLEEESDESEEAEKTIVP